ncbi:4'-phosphopantetheinyl transferase superfamily protein [uncultured Algibacter sp.]|uniref:4'-phosphopantetheinyl transferase family protein n=1 Tax=uncultured Algibacter sp. TaxID=298659 RepID=UPI0026206116|nr:4'-phosphopantetheinyl transferase superfamily protein [uncultured Algibacter sp.]
MERIKLRDRNVHLWVLNLNNSNKKITFLNNYLSENETLKASKFKFNKDKNCSIITRGALRLLSGKYLNLNPKNIKFKYGKYGKPDFDFETNLKFNVSHSGNMAVIGFVLNDDIGIDVEKIKTDFDVFDIVSNYFSSLEIESLKELPAIEQVKGFYRCWTRKESFIKAKAKGLSFPLDSFSVSLDSDEKVELLETKWDKNEKDLWKLFPFSPEEGYLGAVSVKGKVEEVRYFSFNEFIK